MNLNSVYELARDTETTLRRRKFPIGAVAYGPERLAQSACDMRVIFERDRDAGDQVRPPQAVKVNPRRRAVRDQGVRVRVYARSSTPGARVNEHEGECEQLVDAIVVAIGEWFSSERTGQSLPDFYEARYFKPGDLDDAEYEEWPGVAYVLAFRVPRSVDTRDYVGDARPTGTPANVGGDVEVTRAGSDEPPEIVDMP